MKGSDPLVFFRGLVKDAAEPRLRRPVRAPRMEPILILPVGDEIQGHNNNNANSPLGFGQRRSPHRPPSSLIHIFTRAKVRAKIVPSIYNACYGVTAHSVEESEKLAQLGAGPRGA
jgi:hypothetical protein